MSARLWYPQFDVYDTARRIGVLLRSFEAPPGLERLYIADFYLANPPLLHRTSMSMGTRQRFREIGIPSPGKTFVSYPAAPLLFHKMEPVQREAVSALQGRGLVASELLCVGKVALTSLGVQTFESQGQLCSSAESVLCEFLAKHFAATEEIGNRDLRNRTGLHRPL